MGGNEILLWEGMKYFCGREWNIIVGGNRISLIDYKTVHLLYVKELILLSRGKHLNDQVIPLRGVFGPYNQLTPSLFIEMPVQCTRPVKWIVMYKCVLLLFLRFSTIFWNCSDSVVLLYFGIVLTVWYYYILELFWQCGIIICWNCSNSVVLL